MEFPSASSSPSPPLTSLAATLARRSASSASAVATPTSARISASSSESHVAWSMRPARRDATAPLKRPRTLPRRLR